MSQEMGMGAGTLARGAVLVEGARLDFDHLAASLDAEISQLRSQWQGAGGQAFFALQEAWAQRQRQVVAALDGLAEALRTTERDVLDTDAAQAAGYHQDLGRLGG